MSANRLWRTSGNWILRALAVRLYRAQREQAAVAYDGPEEDLFACMEGAWGNNMEGKAKGCTGGLCARVFG